MYNLCCISDELKKEGYGFRTMTWKRYLALASESESDALFKLGERWFNNIVVVREIIGHCFEQGWGYRVPSSIFPLITHPEFKQNVQRIPHMSDIFDVLQDISDNEAWNVRLSMHPDQFNVLASLNENAVEKTITELNYHGWLMDQLGCQKNYYNPINIHINCSKGDPAKIAIRFWNNLQKCNNNVISRLVVENEDKGIWNVYNLINYINKPFKIPITYDNLHDKCNPSDMKDPMTACDVTWDCKPLFHYSESHPNKKNPRCHAEFPTDFPSEEGYDWDIELKGKDYAIYEVEDLEQKAKVLK